MEPQTDIQPIEEDDKQPVSDITLILPLLNEEESLRPLIAKIRDVLNESDWT